MVCEVYPDNNMEISATILVAFCTLSLLLVPVDSQYYYFSGYYRGVGADYILVGADDITTTTASIQLDTALRTDI